MAEFSHPLSELGKVAIPGDSPAGINAKYEPVYETLEAELAKLESISAETLDWQTVRELSSDLLQNTTKDFALASYLTVALMEVEGYVGLRTGLIIFNDLVENFWDVSFPPVKRLRGRKVAVEWFSEKACRFMEATLVSEQDQEHVVESAGLLKNLDFSLSEKMADKAPQVMDLNRLLKQAKQAAEYELKQKKEKESAAAVEAAAVQAQAAVQEKTSQSTDTTEAMSSAEELVPENPPVQAAPATPTPKATATPDKKTAPSVAVEVGDLAGDSDAKKAYRQIQDGLRKLADFYAAQKPSDPRRYRYSRSALWDSIDKLPPNKDGKTQLPKPPADKFKKIQALFEQQEYSEVIAQAEPLAAKMPYWFDGTRLIVSSLEELGAEYQKAKDALVHELVGFISRVPAIVELQYSDGTPFADDQARFWLTTLMASVVADGSGSDQSDALAEVVAEAEKLAASGKLQEGLSYLTDAYTPANERDKYRVRLASAELISNAGHVDVAISLLKQFIENIEKTSVAEWEADFVARAYDLLIRAYERVDENFDGVEEGKNSAFKRLCWLDPITATGITS
ncbi:type VI secretion system protein TssA [Bacterioplanoides sp.]|uniref:type VI secretion system protein TssA n=1 Tax=Bacterioplanoides sp. TaxID=2066072 RepID=UPI003B00B7DC